MNTLKLNLEIVSPKNQLHLFGYKSYFNFFVELFKKKKLPNTMLLSGSKGLGKSTFVYHFANYILSKEEQGEYSTTHFAINKNNLSYKLLCGNIHPNFFTVKNGPLEKEIKIDQIKNLLQFLSKSTYSRDLKIILIDNAEYLNLHSSNALLKAIEETQRNTFFYIIHNSASKILDTIKSRCIEFNFFFTIGEKKNIFKNIANQYFNEFETNELVENLYFDTPGNLIKYFSLLNNENINVAENKLSYIFYFIEKYLNENVFSS